MVDVNISRSTVLPNRPEAPVSPDASLHSVQFDSLIRDIIIERERQAGGFISKFAILLAFIGVLS